MLLLAVFYIYTLVFYLLKSIESDSAWMRESRPYKLSFLSLALVCLEMRHSRGLGAKIPTNAYLTF